MKKKRPTTIGFRNSDGAISDAKFHEEIMRGVDDTPLRIMSALRVMAMGFTQAQAEKLFSVKLSDDDAV
jgi:predicted transposase YbfD/YdcC